MIEDIELPPLPECLLNLPLETLHEIQSHTYHAIKADRQQRGISETMLPDDVYGPRTQAAWWGWRDALQPAEPSLEQDPITADNRKAENQACILLVGLGYAWDGKDWVLVRPAQEPSDSEIMWEWAKTPNAEDMRVDLSVFARAILARYGNRHVEQPSVPDPMKYDGNRDDQYVTGWNDCLADMLSAAPKFGEEK